jgi:hypothetical protein
MAWLDGGVASGPGNETTQTVSGLDVGAADADRWIIAAVAILPDSATGFSGVTIGGETATQMGSIQSEGFTRIGYWKANVPTGTTAAVAVTANGTLYDTAVAVARYVGEPTFSDIAIDDTHASGVYSLTIDVPEDGELLAVLVYQYDTTTADWTGATEDFEDASSSSVHLHGASATGLSEETARAIAVTMGRTTNFFNDALTAITFTLPPGVDAVFDPAVFDSLIFDAGASGGPFNRAAAIVGVGTFGAAAVRTLRRSAAAGAVSGVSASAAVTLRRPAAVGASSSFSALGRLLRSRSAQVVSVGGFAARAIRTLRRSAGVVGLSTFVAEAQTAAVIARAAQVVAASSFGAAYALVRRRAAAVASGSSLAATAARTLRRSASAAATSTFTAAAEAVSLFSRAASAVAASTFLALPGLTRRRAAGIVASSAFAGSPVRALRRSAAIAAAAVFRAEREIVGEFTADDEIAIVFAVPAVVVVGAVGIVPVAAARGALPFKWRGA